MRLEFKEISAKVQSRSRLVQHNLLELISANQPELLTINQILNCLYVLVQEPIMAFVYERYEEDGIIKFLHRPYFDANLAVKSRAIESQFVYYEKNKKTVKATDIYSQVEIDNLIAICPNTDGIAKYYLNLFYLEPNSSDQMSSADEYHEVLFYDEYPSLFRKAAVEDVHTRSVSKIKYYISKCGESLFDVRHTFDKYLGESYLNFVCDHINRIIEKSVQSQKKSSTKPNLLLDDTTIDDVKAVRKQFLKKLYIGGGGFNSTFLKVKTTERSLVNILKDNTDNGELANVFFMIRTFDCQQKRFKSRSFDGFSYKVRFLVPESQKEQISDALKKLKTLQSTIRKYGVWITQDTGSVFTATQKKFIQELDDYFWNKLQEKNKDNKDFGVQKLVKMFHDELSEHSSSLTDTVFSLGLLNFRFPFRKFAGLNRIIDFQDEKQCSIDALEKNGTITDCLRLILFYYCSAMSLPQIDDEDSEKNRTKLMVYPIELYGNVLGVMMSFYRVPIVRKDIANDREWNYVFRLISDAYLVAVRDVRKEYKKVQAELYADWLRESMELFYRQVGDEQHVEINYKESTISVKDKDFIPRQMELHKSKADVLARFIPLPKVNFHATVQELNENIRSHFYDFTLEAVDNRYFERTTELNSFEKSDIVERSQAVITLEEDKVDELFKWEMEKQSGQFEN